MKHMRWLWLLLLLAGMISWPASGVTLNYTNIAVGSTTNDGT
jgi:hypothetical protein